MPPHKVLDRVEGEFRVISLEECPKNVHPTVMITRKLFNELIIKQIPFIINANEPLCEITDEIGNNYILMGELPADIPTITFHMNQKEPNAIIQRSGLKSLRDIEPCEELIVRIPESLEHLLSVKTPCIVPKNVGLTTGRSLNDQMYWCGLVTS